MVKYIIIFLFAIFNFLGCQTEERIWWKGNLHTHSYWSDGNDYPEQIMNWYKNHGYNFVALSDHNILAEGSKWIEFKEGSEMDSIFQAYLEKFGEDWVVWESNGSLIRVRLKTLKEYRDLFEEINSFLIVRSEEITDGFKDKPVHVNATNIQKLIQPKGGNSVVEVMQNNIDAILKQREETGEPMFPHINHPNFKWAITIEDLKKLEGERFFEVYNGHPTVNNYGDSLRSSTEEMWDEVNTHYIINGKELLYGIAVDDAHHSFPIESEDLGRGWIQVRSAKLQIESIIESMEQGNFYSSTGVELRDISYNGDQITVDVKEEEGIEYEIQFIGTLSDDVSRAGILLDSSNGPIAEYSLTGNELYVRAKVISNKKKINPYKEGEVEVAWIQPIQP